MSKSPTSKSLRDNIFHLFEGSDAVPPETKMSTLRQFASDRPASPVTGQGTSIDLTGKPKLVMTFGPGRTGKTLLLRWMIERAQRRQEERPDDIPLSLATVDTSRLALKTYFADVVGPASRDGAMSWLEKLFDRLERAPRTVAVDFGADMTLLPILEQAPTLAESLVTAGVTPVALYLLSTREDDLTILDSMEAAGFQPAATALILNLATMDPGKAPEVEFGQVRRNSTYRAAIERGATEIWMPRHYAAKLVEDWKLPLLRAGDKQTEAGLPSPLGLLDRSRSFHWLEDMEKAFAPIASWTP